MRPATPILALAAHPRLLLAAAFAVAVYVLQPAGGFTHAATRVLIAWCCGSGSYLLLVAWMVAHATPHSMQRRARREAESRWAMLSLAVLAALASLWAIVAQLAAVKDLQGGAKAAHMGLAGLTILLSWAFIHTLFALRYAHDYYGAGGHPPPGGLEFPGAAAPDYGDFLYVAFVIGTSGQTADVAFSSQAMRRLGAVHSVLAFLFNTVLLAMTINIAAGFI